MTATIHNRAETLTQLALRRQRALRAQETLECHRTALRNLLADAIQLGCTHDVIAATLGISRQRVGQLLAD